ncbi:MAG: hypothetical protein NXI01_06705 [Gammaproteobacteria bacterium]|nr:hypothetical protein [Gammaproteobacteria bacterium]
MHGQLSKYLCLILSLFFSSALSAYAKFPASLYVALSGGYGETGFAYRDTGTSSVVRLGLGTLWHANSVVTFGEEIGFQTSNQIRLDSETTRVLGANVVPIFLNIKTPVDLLLMGRYLFCDPVFFQAKGGVVFIGSTVTGSDIQSTNVWLPEMQLGLGIHVSDHSRITLSYQQFFGSQPVITPLDIEQGTSVLKNMPDWHGGLLTLEISI